MTAQEGASLAIGVLDFIDGMQTALNVAEKIAVLKSAAMILEYVQALEGATHTGGPQAFQRARIDKGE